MTHSGRSLAAIVVGNGLTLGVAVAQQWPLAWLVLPFWFQSVVIGVLHLKRILVLRQFHARGFAINRRPVPETAAGKRLVAGFFAMHYGFFHLIYGIFVLFLAGAALREPGALLACCLVLAASESVEHRNDVARDAAGTRSLGLLFFLPYLRVVPMHVIVIVGSVQAGDPGLLPLFVAMKAAAEMLSLWLERRLAG